MTRLRSWLAPDRLSPARARRYVASQCYQLPAETLDVLLLLTSEIVTNAMWHGTGGALLDIQVEADLVTVGVTDGGGGEVGVAADYRWPETGHGLRLVDALSDRWGVEPMTVGTGKRVWFELAWTPRTDTGPRAPGTERREGATTGSEVLRPAPTAWGSPVSGHWVRAYRPL